MYGQKAGSNIHIFSLNLEFFIEQVSQQCKLKGYCTSAWMTLKSRLDWRQWTKECVLFAPFLIIYYINMWSPSPYCVTLN